MILIFFSIIHNMDEAFPLQKSVIILFPQNTKLFPSKINNEAS